MFPEAAGSRHGKRLFREFGSHLPSTDAQVWMIPQWDSKLKVYEKQSGDRVSDLRSGRSTAECRICGQED